MEGRDVSLYPSVIYIMFEHVYNQRGGTLLADLETEKTDVCYIKLVLMMIFVQVKQTL